MDLSRRALQDDIATLELQNAVVGHGNGTLLHVGQKYGRQCASLGSSLEETLAILDHIVDTYEFLPLSQMG
ncbi:hypothetical protein MLD38_001358 [Melastoma candidum]|uniref:Uncharacterized protein n=1 Tax=Melastoma candidum TaxID=119954 RepID=A0ACB9SEZ0_9MYRT|nr:hypothetical protein MLD38_001358 [Melastoma candidum]